MTTFRRCFFSFAGLGALFAIVFAALPAAAYLGPEVPGIFATDVDKAQPMVLHDFYVETAALPVAEQPDELDPDKTRSIGVLKPEYAEAMATDALNVVEVRLRC